MLRFLGKPGRRQRPGKFQHQLAPDRLGKLRPVVDRDHEGARAADDAVGVVQVEVAHVIGAGEAAIGHQRQAVDGDALLDHRVAGDIDRRPLVVRTVARNVDDALHAAELAFGEQIGAEFERGRNRGAARAVGRLGRELRRHALGVLARGDDRPRHDDMMRGRSGPFEIGDGDLAVGAFRDRLQHAVMRECRGIAVALDLQFVRRHGERHVDGQHQLDVDRLGGTAWVIGSVSASAALPNRTRHPHRGRDMTRSYAKTALMRRKARSETVALLHNFATRRNPVASSTVAWTDGRRSHRDDHQLRGLRFSGS